MTESPAGPEFVTLAIAGTSRRHLDGKLAPAPDEFEPDELARVAREEILAANGSRVRAHENDREPMATEGPWLAPLRKAWEPPAELDRPRRRRVRRA